MAEEGRADGRVREATRAQCALEEVVGHDVALLAVGLRAVDHGVDDAREPRVCGGGGVGTFFVLI